MTKYKKNYSVILLLLLWIHGYSLAVEHTALINRNSEISLENFQGEWLKNNLYPLLIVDDYPKQDYGTIGRKIVEDNYHYRQSVLQGKERYDVNKLANVFDYLDDDFTIELPYIAIFSDKDLFLESSQIALKDRDGERAMRYYFPCHTLNFYDGAYQEKYNSQCIIDTLQDRELIQLLAKQEHYQFILDDHQRWLALLSDGGVYRPIPISELTTWNRYSKALQFRLAEALILIDDQFYDEGLSILEEEVEFLRNILQFTPQLNDFHSLVDFFGEIYHLIDAMIDGEMLDKNQLQSSQLTYILSDFEELERGVLKRSFLFDSENELLTLQMLLKSAAIDADLKDALLTLATEYYQLSYEIVDRYGSYYYKVDRKDSDYLNLFNTIKNKQIEYSNLVQQIENEEEYIEIKQFLNFGGPYLTSWFSAEESLFESINYRTLVALKIKAILHDLEKIEIESFLDQHRSAIHDEGLRWNAEKEMMEINRLNKISKFGVESDFSDRINVKLKMEK